ncbi:MAG: efflux RND transporter periplasmic adaptor subunit [Chitinophagales bacterium]
MNNIKQISIFTALIIMAFSLYSCGGEAKSDEPKTPEMRKAILEKRLNDKRTEVGKMQYEVKELEKQLLALDPNFKKKEEQKKWRMVSVTQIDRKNFEQFSEFQGTVTTKGDFVVSSETGGRIKTLNAKEGDYVKKGQLIGTTDDAMMQSNMSELQTAMNLAQDVYSRRQKLWSQKIGSELELIQAKNQVETLQKNMATLRTQMSKTSFYSPDNGVVEEVMVKQGEMAGAGSPILRMLNTASVQVTADIPENYLKNVKRGERVKITIPALEMEQNGRISKISSTINPSNRTFGVEIGISSKGGKVKPNLMAMIEIKEFSKKNAVIVPTNLILNDMESDYVYIVADGDKPEKKIAKRVNIVIGADNDGETYVEEGLKGDEQIITEGYRMVNNGDPIKVVE